MTTIYKELIKMGLTEQEIKKIVDNIFKKRNLEWEKIVVVMNVIVNCVY